MTKLAPKKLKNNLFQDRFYSLKAHAHYFTVFLYLATWRAAKFGIFTHMFTNLPRCSQSMNSLIYIYIYSIQIPSYFLWVFDHSHGHTVSCYCCPKKFLYYLLCDFRVKLVTMHCIGLVRLSLKFDVGQPISSWKKFFWQKFIFGYRSKNLFYRNSFLQEGSKTLA